MYLRDAGLRAQHIRNKNNRTERNKTIYENFNSFYPSSNYRLG
ncbi:MAG: hypothetical protein OFPI_18080 [Osedax symbiont Rs2]|nr:MAG: hypothetical protein OFPI_18080 [Osedax symbiont Rs2]